MGIYKIDYPVKVALVFFNNNEKTPAESSSAINSTVTLIVSLKGFLKFTETDDSLLRVPEAIIGSN